MRVRMFRMELLVEGIESTYSTIVYVTSLFMLVDINSWVIVLFGVYNLPFLSSPCHSCLNFVVNYMPKCMTKEKEKHCLAINAYLLEDPPSRISNSIPQVFFCGMDSFSGR